MKNLRIALGYKTGHRNSEPSILAAGFEKGALQAAVDSAPAEFLRFEFGTFFFGQRARRTLGVSAPEPADDFPIKGPTEEDALAMFEEIERLRGELSSANAAGVAAVAEIERLKAELAAAIMAPAPASSANPSPAVTETPAAGTAPAEPAAESSAEDSDPSLLPPGTGRKKRS